MEKIKIRMLSAATTVDGQGVGSAYMEQVVLVKEQSDLFEVYENKKPHGVKVDINHIHTVNPKFRVRMNKKQPNVMYVHFLPSTLDGSLKMPYLFFKVFKKYVINMYKHADEIVVVNPIFTKPLIELGVKKENITYIPNYVSKESFYKISDERRKEVRKQYGIDENAFVVMGCGQVQTRKGVTDYIKVAEANPDITFVWAGGFSFGVITDGYKELKAIMENPPKNVKFIGLIKRDKMNDVFNMSDVLFMPSYAELFPMSILEAANAEKPILLRDLDLYEDILFHKYIARKDNEGFGEELRKLKDDKKYYEEYSKASKYIGDYYSKEHVGEMWREYYPRILKKFKENKKHKSC